jgi:hypothetical protein
VRAVGLQLGKVWLIVFMEFQTTPSFSVSCLWSVGVVCFFLETGFERKKEFGTYTISPSFVSRTVLVMVIFVIVPSKKATLTSSPTTTLLLSITEIPAAKLLITFAKPKPMAKPKNPNPMRAPMMSKAKKMMIKMLPIA